MELRFGMYNITLSDEQHLPLFENIVPIGLKSNFVRATLQVLTKKVLEIELGKRDQNHWLFIRSSSGCSLSITTPPLTVKEMVKLEQSIFPEGVPEQLYCRPVVLSSFKAAEYAGAIIGRNLALNQHWSVGMET